MSTLFRVESSDIEALNALQLTTLLELLLHLEARNAGIAERAVEVALNINVPDGGEDGRICWSGDPSSTEFLPLQLVQFQNKATSMFPKDCAEEITNSDGTMKPMVEEVLDGGGAYILFTTQGLVKKKKDARIKAIRDKLAELGKTYADTAIIDIYDASRIEGWVNKYIASIVAVLNWIGRPLERGLKTWEDWSRHDEYQRFPFVTDIERESALNSLRCLLNNYGSCARIIGLSGMGKTRLAFETFRDSEDIPDLSKRVVYLDAKANPSIQGLISDWVQCGLEGIVVVDNCEIKLHGLLKKEVKRSDSKLSLLTLDYDLERTSQTEVVHLKKLPDEHIKQMLEPVYGKEIQDLDRIIAFAQGFPQMAVLLADARLDKEPEMGRLTDDDLAHRMLWGGQTPSMEDEQILRGCSLFDRFGMEDAVATEYEFIANSVVCIDVDKFYDCVKRFEERGLIDRRGRFAMLVPKPLAIRLAAEWWRRTRPDRQEELIQTDMPGDLIDSFCNQISRLDFLPEVKTLTEALCGNQGPFGQAEVILSDRGSRLFRALVEVNPDSTSKALSNILKILSEDELSQIEGGVRRNLVRALEKLCFHEACFEDSAASLLLLASSENEDWANNATGVFKQLFRTFLSGTEAPPSMRLRLIDYALSSEHATTVRELAVVALEQAITTYSGTRWVGAEYQGSGEPLQEWRPKVWGDAFDYWDKALMRLCNLIVVKDPLAPLAKASIANHIRGLMQYGRVDILDTVIRKIVDEDGALWPEALGSIKDSLCYEGDTMPGEGKTKLQEWISLLTPSDLGDRLNLLITRPSYEHEKKADGHYEDIAAQNAKLLAEELAGNIDSIVPFIDNLLIGEQRQAYWFGKNLVETAGAWEPVLSVVMEKIVSIKDPNIKFLLGILDGIFHIDASEWNSIVKNFSETENLYQYYAYVLVTGNVTADQLETLIKLVGQNKIDPSVVTTFGYGRPLEHLNHDVVSTFVKNFAAISDHAAWIALDVLSMYCYGNSAKWDNCKSAFKEIIIRLKLDGNDKKHGQREMHHWQEVAKKLLKSEGADFAIDLARQILSSCTDEINYGDLWHYIQPTLRIVFQKHTETVWPLFSEVINDAEPLEEFRIKQLMSNDSFKRGQQSVLAEIPDEFLNEWCLQNPLKAPEFIAQTTEVLLEYDDGYKISPRAQFLLDNFGDNENVLSALSANLSSFGWSGSLVPYLKKEIAAIEALKDHKDSNVASWANRRIDYLTKMIEKESRRDEEHDWGIYS